MKVLILGYSSIVSRRVLPALMALPGIERIDIASRRPREQATLPATWQGGWYQGYETGLAESPADLVYISLVNNLHEEWTERALAAGRHVVVEKPAFLSLSTTERLAARAEQADRLLAEAVVIADHPQMDLVRQAVAEAGGATRLIATFSFPPLPADSYRYNPALGGGAFLDVGPYAAASSRLFFSDPPAKLHCEVLSRHPETHVDTAFTLAAIYSGGRSLVGHFGFDTEYQNRLTVLGPAVAVTFDRVFSTPPDLENTIHIARKNVRETLTAEAGDSFGRFFARMRDMLAGGARSDWRRQTEPMLADAAFLERMRRAASVL